MVMVLAAQGSHKTGVIVQQILLATVPSNIYIKYLVFPKNDFIKLKQCDSSIDAKKKHNIKKTSIMNHHYHDGPMFADFVPPNSFFQGAFHTTSGRSHQ